MVALLGLSQRILRLIRLALELRFVCHADRAIPLPDSNSKFLSRSHISQPDGKIYHSQRFTGIWLLQNFHYRLLSLLPCLADELRLYLAAS